MKLSVLIPAHNEEECIEATVSELYAELRANGIDHEILIVNDNSTDGTQAIVERLNTTIPSVRYVNSVPPSGYGLAVRRGLEEYTGDAVAIYMADASDTPEDLVRFFRVMESTGTDCVFGSRFMNGSRVVDYPLPKLVLNRLANVFIQVLFRLRYNDMTNAFKLFRRGTIDGLHPILSHHFNLTVELPLKAIVRGYEYEIVPNAWINRKTGVSKLKIHEMGSRYLFIVLYCLIEQLFSRNDYRRKTGAPSSEG